MSRMLYRALARACNNTVGNRALDPNACYWAISSTRTYCANRPNKPYKKKSYDKAHRTDRHTSGSLQNRDDLTKKQLPVSLEKRNQQDRQKESIPLEERIPKDTELYKIYNELRDLEKEMERLDNEFDSLFTVESFKKLAEKRSESEYVSNSTSSEERESEYTNSEKSDSGSDDMDLDDNVSSEQSDSGSDDTNSDDTDSYDDMNSEESDSGSDDTNSDDMDSDDDMSSEESDSGSEVETFSRQNRRFYKDRRR